MTIRISTGWFRTGETAVRVGFRGKLVLQVMEMRRLGMSRSGQRIYNEGVETRWRDATLADLKSVAPPKAKDERDLLPPPGEK